MAIEIDRNRRCSGARLSATSARRPCRKQDHCHFATRKATRRSVSLASDGQEQRRNFGYSEVSRVYSMVENTSRVILVAGGTGLFNAKTQRRKDAKRQRGFVYRWHIFSSSSSSFSSSPRLSVKNRLPKRHQRDHRNSHKPFSKARNIRAAWQLARAPQALPVAEVCPIQV